MEDIKKINNKIIELEKQVTLLREMCSAMAHNQRELAQAVVRDLRIISDQTSKEE